MPHGFSVRDALNRIQYGIRESTWGGAKLRSGLPRVDASADRPELEFYRLVLRAARGDQPEAGVSEVWDIGCRNWSYARALSERFPGAELIGVEADGKRRYWNLYRRMDVALAYAKAVPGARARCLFSDFRDVSLSEARPGALFCFFFPFVSENPCLSWGLPLRFAQFGSLLAHARKVPGARILSCHQGEWEGELARRAWGENGFSVSVQSVLEPEFFRKFWPSSHPVTVLS